MHHEEQLTKYEIGNLQRDLMQIITEDLKILDTYERLSDFFMLDYYTLNGYKLLPESWLASAKKEKYVFLHQLCKMLIQDNSIDKSSLTIVMPLSLLCFIRLMKNRLEARNKVHSVSIELPITCKEQMRFLKPKKIIEIKSLLPHVTHIINEHDITHVVDIGSGVGHVSRFIAKQNPDCYILRIEAQSSLIEKAEAIDQKFAKCEDPVNILSSVKLLKLDVNIANSFHSILEEIDDLNSDYNFSHPDSRILLLGLHPCGNLGSFMLKLFKESPLCKGIIAVSCCYLYIDAEEGQQGGFPLSNFLVREGVTELSCQVKEQACHNAEFYLHRLLSYLRKPNEMLFQHWRSIADIFICKRDSEYSRKCLKFKKPSHREDIISFINRNLLSHKFELLSDEEGIEAQKLAVVDQWKTWVYYLVYITKLLIGVIGESLILSDRLLYLVESNISSSFSTVFDPMVSPRNTAIVSFK